METKPNWDGMSEQLFEHGIRNKTVMCEAPVPQPQPIMDATCGVEPWMMDMFEVKKSPNFEEREFASCIVTPGGDDIDQIILAKMKSLNMMMEAGLEGAIIRPDMGYGGIKRNEANIIMGRTPGKSKVISLDDGYSGSDTFRLKNLYYGTGCYPQLVNKEEEDNTKKPPKGRSQKAHNLIQQMNKRKR